MRRAAVLPILFLALNLTLLSGRDRAFAWSFAVTGDSHDDRSGLFARVLSAVDGSDMEFLVHVGDMTERNREAEWDRFLRAIASLRKPLYPVIGNRDRIGKGAGERFARRFGLPGTSYSFDHKDAHFAVLDNAGLSLTDKALARLDRDLAAHPKGKNGIAFLVVAMHVPPATDEIRPHGTRPGYEERSRKLLRILKEHRVDAVLAGHEHMNLSHDWEGILVVVTGIERIPFLPLQRTGFYRIDLEDGAVRGTFVRIDATP
jgi:predicted phosphodiesterase